jgi:hypothetical protein
MKRETVTETTADDEARTTVTETAAVYLTYPPRTGPPTTGHRRLAHNIRFVVHSIFETCR